ncbi:MAG: polysaccharide deacetylase family protein [bacterium]|nr:polysaccharide deacetylase family protein [bacterium]
MKHLLLIQPNSLLRKFYPQAIWHLDRSEKSLYLTFDDGPIAGLSEWVLDELDKFNAKATFFCVGENIKKHFSIFDRIKAEGHAVANHTMTHSKGFRTSVPAYLDEIKECEKLVDTNLFRPPYGQMKPGQYKALIEGGYKVVLWDVISYDYEKISQKKCASNVIRNAKNGSIVLFHDNIKAEKNLKYALPLFLKHFSREGYRFKALVP